MPRHHLFRTLLIAALGALGVALSGCPIVVTCEDIPCPFGETCDVESGLCQPAVRDCRIDEGACRGGEVCDEVTGQCRPEQLRCGDQFVQCPAGQACNATVGRCEPASRCESDGDCGPAEECNEASGECEPRTCAPSADDCPLAHVCGEDGRCMPGCRAGEDSCPNLQFCLVVTGDAVGRCVPNCRVDQECPFGQICDLAGAPESRCVAEGPCSSDADCRTDEVCSESACVQPPCAADADCRDGQVCETSTGLCRDAGCADDVYGLGDDPNHTRATAFGLAPGEYTELKLCPGRADWFAIETRTTDILRLRLRQHAAQPDVDIFVYDDAGNLLAADEQLGTISSVKFASGRDQIVYAEFRTRGFGEVTYDLSITTEFCPNDTFEENDSRNSPTIVPSSVGVPSDLALMSCGFDEDWFRLTIPSPDNGLRVERIGGTPDLDVDAFTPDGETLSVGRDAPLELLRSGASGQYHVRAYGALGQTGSYRLAFEILEPWECPDAGERSTPETARATEEARPAVETFCPLDAAWEIDWHHLGELGDGFLDARLTPIESAPALDVVLVEDEGAETRIVRTSTFIDGEHVIQATVLPDREYYLRVSSSAPLGRIATPPQYETVWQLDTE